MSTSKVVLITGASSGIGKATAQRLIRDGYTVYGAARRVEKMHDLVAAGGHALSLDVTDEVSCEAAIQAILDAEGRIDVLVNNAGYAVYGAVEDVPLDDARRQFEVNLFGLAEVTKLVLPTMRAQRSGTIVNISSMGGRSTHRSGRGITPPSMLLKAGPTASASSWRHLESTWSSSSPVRSRLSSET